VGRRLKDEGGVDTRRGSAGVNKKFVGGVKEPNSLEDERGCGGCKEYFGGGV
jgi:hypothetical protein